MQADSGSFSLGTPAAGLLTATLRVNRGAFAIEFPRALTNYIRIYSANTQSFSSAGQSVDFSLGFYQDVDSQGYVTSFGDGLLKRALKLVGQTESFAVGASSVSFPFGYRFAAQRAGFNETNEERTYAVTVVSTGSGNKYVIDGVQQAALDLPEGGTYTFDQSDSSNNNHPLRFSTTSNGTHGGGSEYVVGVSTSGVPGNPGAFTRVTVAAGAPDLHYYCVNHSGMGSTASTPTATGIRTYRVIVVSTGSGNKYFVDGVQQAVLDLSEGGTYTFDQSDSSNNNHPLRFSTTDNGTHGGGSAYTTGVTTNGIPGSPGAFTRIRVAAGAPDLYYYCVNHSGMGSSASTPAVDGSDLRKISKLPIGSKDYELEFNLFPRKALIDTVTTSATLFAGGQVGFKNEVISPLDTGLFTPAKGRVGGSDKASPSFLRPERVQFNSVSKSRDLGAVDNFLGEFTGAIGASSGTQTLYFKIETLGDADLLIRKKAVNRFTDNQISVGILDSNKKSVKVNDFGFAYRNEIVGTELKEFLEPLPKGVYYFTISGSSWQSIPYHVSIQVIRYVSLDGSAKLSASLSGRFSLVKPRGQALLTAPLAGSMPLQEDIKNPAGAAVLTSATQGTFVKMGGVAIGRLLPTGRLKHTHRIVGAAIVSNANVATLSATPSSGYGYP